MLIEKIARKSLPALMIALLVCSQSLASEPGNSGSEQLYTRRLEEKLVKCISLLKDSGISQDLQSKSL